MAPPRGGVDLEAYYGGPEKPPRDRRSSSAAAHTASPVFSLRAALQRTDCPASPCPPPRKDPTPCTTFEQLLCSCGLPRGMLSFGFGGRHIKRSDDAPRDQSDVRPADDDAAAYGCAVRLLISGEVREHDVCAALVRRGWRRAVAERVSYDLRRVTGVDPSDVEKPPKAIEAAAEEPSTTTPPAPAPPPAAPPSPGSSSWGSAPASPVGTREEPAAPPPDDDKYARMLAMGVPATAVEHKMRSQGLDEASIARALAAAPAAPAAAAAAPAAGSAAAFPQYDRMLRVGLDLPRVLHKMRADGVDAADARRFADARGGAPDPAPAPARRPAAPAPATPVDAPAPSPAAPRRRATMTLHWDKVDASRAPKLWAEERPSEAAALDGDDVAAIEALFAQEPPRRAPASTSARRGSERRAAPPGAALLDPKRAQNVTIAVSRVARKFDGDMDRLWASVAQLDARLGADDYERLRPALPSDGECAAVRAWLAATPGRDAASLGAAERFVDAAGRAGDRAGLLDTALAVSGFDARLVAAESAAEAVLAAAAAVLDSGGLARALRHILAVGNAMNAGTARGDAVGVTLASLGQIVHTKGRDRSTTVLDYVVRALSKRGHAPEVRRAARDLPGLVDGARRVPVADVLREHRALEDAVRGARRALAAAAAAAADLDGAVADEEMENMAEHEAPRFFDTFTKSAGFSLFRAAERRRSRSPSVQADAARRRGAHAVAGRRAARLGAFVDRSARAAARLRRRVEDVTSKVDALCDYFGEDDSTKILEDLHVFLRALVAALAKADDEPGAARDADYDMAGGRDARRRILGRREALFPSNAQ